MISDRRRGYSVFIDFRSVTSISYTAIRIFDLG